MREIRFLSLFLHFGFPHSSVGKESTYNAGDPGSIPRLRRSAGEGIGYPLQYSWASLVAQLVKNPPAMWGDLGSIPGLERSPGEGKGYSTQVFWPGEFHGLYSWGCRVGHNWATFGEGNGTPLQYSCLENPMDGGAWKAAVRRVAEGRTRLSDFTFTFHFHALEKEMATHSSVLAWRIPGTGEPSMGLHRVGHDWSDLAVAVAERPSLHVYIFRHVKTCLSHLLFLDQ